MRVKEAFNKLEEVRKLSNNMGALHQYFLNHPDKDEEIAELCGINKSVRNTLKEVLCKIEKMANKYEKAIMEAEIEELDIC